MTSGAVLKAEREWRGVSVSDLARAHGLKNHSRISQIEALASVTPKAEAKYRRALETVASGETSGEAVA